MDSRSVYSFPFYLLRFVLWKILFLSSSRSLSKASFLSRLLAAIRFAWRFSHDPNELVVANYSNCWLLGGTNLLRNQVPLVSVVILFDLSVAFVSARVVATRRRKRSVAPVMSFLEDLFVSRVYS